MRPVLASPFSCCSRSRRPPPRSPRSRRSTTRGPPPRSPRGAPLTFAVRTARSGRQRRTSVCRAAKTVDADGLLTRPEGTWLDEIATPERRRPAGLDGPGRLRAPSERPGHYYWQAYLTGAAVDGAEEPIGPVQPLTVRQPMADRGRGKLFPRYGRNSTGKSFFLSSTDFPGTVDGARFKTAGQEHGVALGPEGAALDERKGRSPGRFQRRRLFIRPRRGRARRADRLRRARQDRRERPRAARRRELGAGARLPGICSRSTSRASSCTNSGTWPATRSNRSRCTNTPMIEALGAGEWWRGDARQDGSATARAFARTASVRKRFVHRLMRID